MRAADPEPTRTPTVSGEARASQIATWLDNPSEYARAAEVLAGWGNAAIEGLRSYLRGKPQVIPQPRCFAVAMLARIPGNDATCALREVLHAHPLKTLEPTFAESEYVVKCDALGALAVRDYRMRRDDIVFGVHERLRIGVAAAGRLRVVEVTDALVDLLDDDVLAAAAMTSLAAMGPEVAQAIQPRLDAWATEATFSARRRLALIRALRVLHQVTSPGGVVVASGPDWHPAVQAAVALLASPVRRDPAMIETLLRGAIGFDPDLADDCREALESSGIGMRMPAARALARNAEPDVYGDLHPLSSEQRDWLLARLQRSDATLP